jgi:two-component sensor histidine kinase
MSGATSTTPDESTALPHGYDLHDSSTRPSLDGIATAAAAICKAPVAAISFADDGRQWTGGGHGLEHGRPPVELVLAVQALCSGEVFVIEDLTADPRFARLPAVAGAPGWRACASVPLLGHEGRAIGSLCVLDRMPRRFSDEERLMLQTLARHAMSEMDLRRALRAEQSARLQIERVLAEKQELLARNEILIGEVDHRVKNSLQLVSSMLGVQARQVRNHEAAAALEEAQRRIAGIAAVHEHLYSASHADAVDMAVFLTRLCGSLAENRPRNVHALNVTAEPIAFASKRAMKTGLLVTELVINGFKHAYPADREGEIAISLTGDQDHARLVVEDQGVGLPEGFAIDGNHGLGMRLIRAVLSQFGGTMTVEAGPGARFIVDMPHSGPVRSG